MKVLKAALACLVVAVVAAAAASAPTGTAVAETVKYAMALTDDVYIYDEMQNNTELFALPATYCVEITREYDGWYRVNYAEDEGLYEKVTGYCKKDDLQLLDGAPVNLYLNYPVEVTLFSGADPKSGLPGLELTVTAAFYGNYYRANTSYIYLKYGGGFGYVEGKIDDYVKNDIPSAPVFSENEPQTDKGSSALVPALVLGALALTAVAVLVITGRRHKRQ